MSWLKIRKLICRLVSSGWKNSGSSSTKKKNLFFKFLKEIKKYKTFLFEIELIVTSTNYSPIILFICSKVVKKKDFCSVYGVADWSTIIFFFFYLLEWTNGGIRGDNWYEPILNLASDAPDLIFLNMFFNLKLFNQSLKQCLISDVLNMSMIHAIIILEK